MDKGKCSKICVFCTAFTTYKPIKLGTYGILQQFCNEFFEGGFQFDDGGGGSSRSLRKCEDKLPENWAVCGDCLPSVQSVLGRKEKVSKVEAQVRKLQGQILKELKCLMKEVGGMCDEMRVVQAIMTLVEERNLEESERGEREGRPMRRRNAEDDELIGQFREQVANVLEDLENFKVSSRNKLLLGESFPSSFSTESRPRRRQTVKSVVKKPKVKKSTSSKSRLVVEPVVSTAIEPESLIKTEPPEDDLTENIEGGVEDFDDAFHAPSPVLDSPPPDLDSPPPDLDDDECPPMEQDAEDMKGDTPNQSNREKRRRSQTKKQKLDVSDLGSDSSSEEDFSDEDFDPDDITMRSQSSKSYLKALPTFRKNLIVVVRERDKVSTSKYLPSDPEDPRRNYYIRYDFGKKRFFIDDLEIICMDKEKLLKCSQCDVTFQTKHRQKAEDLIYDHILAHHLNAFTCTYCSHVSRDFCHYNGHKIAHEEGANCDICGKPFANTRHLKTHKWLHLGEEEKKDPANAHMMPHRIKFPELYKEKRYQCTICGKAFQKNAQLTEHMETHQNPEEREKYVCPDCGAVGFRTTFKMHQKICLKARMKGINCPVCNELIKSGKKLDKHIMQFHPDARPFSCDICGKGFRNKMQMRCHKEIHNEEKHHMCKFCGRGFNQKKNMNRHEKTCGGGGGGERPTERNAKGSRGETVKTEYVGEIPITGSFDHRQFLDNYF